MQGYACPRCGKKTSGDFLSWKGGINRAICNACEQEEKKKEQEREKNAD
ncbi:MAG: hypothetical protein Q7J85_03450 [Bacillota bacterium]|nr:hypothetical protein [Bacillota bacterium]